MIISAERLKKYNLTQSSFDNLYAMQKGKCACLGESLEDDVGGIAIDHDHTTLKIRGLLCRSCNTLLGRLGDNLDKANAKLDCVRNYLTMRQHATSLSLISTVTEARAEDLLDNYLKHDAPTWMSRCAGMLGYGFNLHGVFIENTKMGESYGIGSAVGYNQRNVWIAKQVGQNIFDGNSLSTGFVRKRTSLPVKNDLLARMRHA